MIKILQHLCTPKKTNNHKPRLLHVEGLLVLTGIVVMSLLAVTSASRPHGALPAILGFSTSIQADQVVSSTNAVRQQNGLSSLRVNTQLVAAALSKGNNMCAEQYWAHVSPKGLTPWVFMKNAGYKYSVAGENLARDFADTSTMVGAWMASPTHKANILNTKYSEIGVAVIQCSLLGSDTAVVVQMFGTQQVSAARKPAPVRPVTQRVPAVKAAETVAAEERAEEVPIVAENIQGEDSVPAVLVDTEPVLELPAVPERAPVFAFFTPVQAQKAVLVAVLLLALFVLAIDMWYVQERRIIRVSSRSLGHFLILGAVLMAVLIMKAGSTL